MALTAKRKGELADEIDTFATWINHKGRAGRIRAVAAELRGEDPDEAAAESVEALEARLEAARQREVEANVAAAEQLQKNVKGQVDAKVDPKS